MKPRWGREGEPPLRKTPSVRAIGSSPLARARRICLALPDATETITWGSPHFRVANKIFCGLGEERGSLSLTFKLQAENAAAIRQDQRFRQAPYVGKHGWVSIDVASIDDWDGVAMLIRESYGLIAPKASLAKLHLAQPQTKTRAKKGRSAR